MAVPQRVIRWVDDRYKRPRVDPEWLSDCYAWLTTEAGHNPDTDFQGLVDAVEVQLLQSNFTDSMLPGTGLPTHVAVSTTSMTLTGTQVLVEVASITEIANSAFNLDQTRQAREERLKDGDVEDEEGEGDIDIAGEGPIPKYPRGMLKFQLTDGTTTLPAIEYRPLSELSLENTPLGFKMLLKDVRINRGIAFLEPKCVVLVGYKTDDRDENRLDDFARGLHARMGLPGLPPANAGQNYAAPAPAARNPTQLQAPAPRPRPLPPAEIRSPLRDISPPSSPPAMYNNDDEDLETRRRRIPNRKPEPDLLASSTIRSLPSSSRTITSSYFANSSSSSAGASSSVSNPRSQTAVGSTPGPSLLPTTLSPTIGQSAPRNLHIASPPPSPGPEDEHFWSDDDMENQMPPPQPIKFLDDLAARKASSAAAVDANRNESGSRIQKRTAAAIANRNESGSGIQTRAAAARNASTNTTTGASTKTNKSGSTNVKTNANGKRREISFSSDEFGDDFMFDADALAKLDAIEASNTTAGASSSTGNTNTRTSTTAASTIASTASAASVARSSSHSGPSTVGGTSRLLDVITIEDDSDDDDKENLPVPTRHVRRRFDSEVPASQGGASQRARDPGRQVILATNASDILDLSDSD